MIIATEQKLLSDVQPTFATGDILLFEGNPNNPLDWMIQHETGEPYTHAGMIVVLDGTQYFWDAPGAGQTFMDPITKTAHTGCRVAPLDQLLPYYMQSEVAAFYRKLLTPLTPEQLGAMMIFITAADGTQFPGDQITMPVSEDVKLGLGLIWSYGIGKKFGFTPENCYFCAQLVAETYMRMGLMKLGRASNAFAPGDWAIDSALPLNCTLGPVTKLETSAAAMLASPVNTPLNVSAVNAT